MNTTPEENSEVKINPADTVEDTSSNTSKQDKEWWDDPAMPWRHKPQKSDIACMSWMGAMSLYGLGLLPLRAWLLGFSPALLAMLTGGRTSIAAAGALASVGQLSYWPWVLLAASILSLKFDWIFWWAGKLWGRGMLEAWGQGSKGAARRVSRAEKWATKLGTLGMFVAYLPVPLLMQVVFVLFGASGMSLKRFMVLDYIAGLLWLTGYFYLGWALGKQAVDILNLYAKISVWVALGLAVFVFITSMIKSKKKMQAS